MASAAASASASASAASFSPPQKISSSDIILQKIDNEFNEYCNNNSSTSDQCDNVAKEEEEVSSKVTSTERELMQYLQQKRRKMAIDEMLLARRVLYATYKSLRKRIDEHIDELDNNEEAVLNCDELNEMDMDLASLITFARKTQLNLRGIAYEELLARSDKEKYVDTPPRVGAIPLQTYRDEFGGGGGNKVLPPPSSQHKKRKTSSADDDEKSL